MQTDTEDRKHVHPGLAISHYVFSYSETTLLFGEKKDVSVSQLFIKLPVLQNKHPYTGMTRKFHL